MKQKHTPGDWYVEHLDPYWAIVGDGIEDVGFIRSEADAALVAATPMLLRALKALVDLNPSANDSNREEARQIALTAIAFAEGKDA